MKFKRHRLETVKGYRLPSPALTPAAWRLILLYVCAPFLGTLVLLDLFFYWLFRFAFNSCYGIWCLF